MMILFLLTEALDTILNDESGLSEMSVAAWTISYDIDTYHHLCPRP
jgi:hypothetical protein